jgi:chromosome segregation ATPase
VAEAKDGAMLLGLIRGLEADEAELAQFVASLHRACGELHYNPKGVVRHMATVDGLEAKGNELVASIRDVEAMKATASGELRQLNAQLNAKRVLVRKIAEVEGIGLSTEDLETLRRTVAAIGARNRLDARGSMRKLLTDLQNQYDPVLGFENQLSMLKSRIEKYELDTDTARSTLLNLAARYRARTSAIDAMEALAGKGVGDEQIVYLNSLLVKAGSAGVEEFSEGLTKYDSLQGLIAAKEEAVKRLGEEADRLGSQVEDLKAEKAQLEDSIKVQVDSINAKTLEVEMRLGQYRNLEPLLRLISSRDGDPPTVFVTMHQLCLAFGEWLVGKPLKDLQHSIMEEIGPE